MSTKLHSLTENQAQIVRLRLILSFCDPVTSISGPALRDLIRHQFNLADDDDLKAMIECAETYAVSIGWSLKLERELYLLMMAE